MLRQLISPVVPNPQFDDSSIKQKDPNKVEAIQNPFNGFNWDGFGFTTCPGTACHSFPANVTQQFTAPRLAMAEGLVGGLLIGKIDLATSPKGSFALADPKGSFDLGTFDVFDIIDLPVRVSRSVSRVSEGGLTSNSALRQEQVKLGAKEDMRVHLDCTSAGDGAHVKLTIPFDRNKDSAGYSVTKDKLGDKFVGLSKCTITTTQVFFPLGHELEIPTESMGCEWLADLFRWRRCVLTPSCLCLVDNLNVCVR